MGLAATQAPTPKVANGVLFQGFPVFLVFFSLGGGGIVDFCLTGGTAQDAWLPSTFPSRKGCFGACSLARSYAEKSQGTGRKQP